MRIFKLLIIVFVVFIPCYCIVLRELVSYRSFIKTDFLFTFLGVFIGFALTLYTYLTSMFENMKKIIKQKYANNIPVRDDKLNQLPLLHQEIKDNILFLIYALIFVVTIAIFDKKIDAIDLCSFYFNAPDIKNGFLLTLFVLSVYALYDLVVTSFKISDFIVKN